MMGTVQESSMACLQVLDAAKQATSKGSHDVVKN